MASVDERVVSIKLKDDNFQKGIDQIVKALAELKKVLQFSGAEKGFSDLDKAAKSVKFDSMAKNASEAQKAINQMTTNATEDMSELGSSAQKSFSQVGDAASSVKMTQVSDQVDGVKNSFSSLGAVAADALGKLNSTRVDMKPAQDAILGVSSAIQKFDTTPMVNAIERVNTSFDAMSIAGIAALGTLASKATEAGMQMASNLTQSARDGLGEYELQMNSIQTIMANTASKGTTMDQVNKALGELNTYADQTIYNFSEMTRNIGTFTAAGVDLDTSVSAIKGIANLAAVSGSSSQQASTAMYQLSQALATGTVKLMDWNSVVNAGMGGEGFQKQLIQTARVMGIAVDDAIIKQGSFRDSLQEGWLTTDVLLQTLKQYAGEVDDAGLKQQGYTDAQIQQIKTLGTTAKDAATKVKTFTALIDTYKEQVGSGWAQTWQLIFGDFEEARNAWTSLSEKLGTMVSANAAARNAVVESWAKLGGRKELFGIFEDSIDAFLSWIKPIKEAWAEVFPPKDFGATLYKITKAIHDFVKGATLTGDAADGLKTVFKVLFTILKIVLTIFKALVTVIGAVVMVVGKLAKAVFSVISIFAKWVASLADVVKQSGFIDNIKNKIIGLYEAVRNTFADTGLFEDFKTGLTDALSGITKFLTPVATFITGVLYGVFDGLTASVHDSGSAFEYLGNVFKTIGSEINRWGTEMQQAFTDKFGDVPVIAAKVAQGIQDAFHKLDPVFQWIKGAVDKVRDVLFTFFADLNGNITVDQILSVINGGFLLALLKNASNFLKGMMSSVDNADNISDKIDSLLGKIGDSFESFQQSMSIGRLLLIAIAIGVLAGALNELAQLNINQITTGLVGLGSVAATLAAFITALSALAAITTKAGKNVFNMAALNDMAFTIAALGAAIYLMAKGASELKGMKPEEIAIIFGVMSGALLAMGGSIALIAGSIGKVDTVKLLAFEGVMKSIAIGMIGMAASMILLAQAVLMMSGMNVQQAITGIGSIIVLLTAIGGFIVIIGKFSGMKRQLKDFGLMMIELGAAFILLAIAVKILSGMSIQQALIGVGSIVSLMIAVAGMAVVVNEASDLKGHFVEFGKAMIALGAALTLMAIAIRIVGELQAEQAAQGIVILATALVAMTASIKSLDGVNVISVATGLMAMAAALTLLSIPIGVLGKMYPQQLVQGLGSLVIVMMAMAVALKHIDEVNIANSAVGMLAMAAALTALVIPIALLGSMSFGTLLQGLLGMAAAFEVLYLAGTLVGPLAVELTALAKAVALMGAGLFAAGAGIALFSAGILALSAAGAGVTAIIANVVNALIMFIPLIAKSIANAVVAILAVLAAAFPHILQSLGKMIDDTIVFLLDKVPKIADAVVVMVDQVLQSVADHADTITENLVRILVAAMNAVAGHAPEITAAAGKILNAIFSAIGNAVRTMDSGAITNMIVTFGAMAVLFKVMSGMKKDVVGALMVGGSMLLLMTGLVGVFALMSLIDPQSQMATGTALAATLIGMSVALKVMGSLKADIANALLVAAPMGVILLGLVAIFGLMEAMNLTSQIQNAVALSTVLLAISAAVVIMSLIPVSAAAMAVASLGVVIAGITAIVLAMGAISQIPGFDWLVSEGATALAAVGKAIGGFAGSIVGGVLEGISSSLPTVADNLSAFMMRLTPFIVGAKMITPESMAGVQTLAQVVLTLTGASILDGIARFLGGGDSLSKFGDELAAFGPKMVAYGNSVAGLNTTAIENSAAAAKAMVQVAQAVPNEGGLAAFFAGDNTLSQFGDSLVPFGESMVKYANSVSGLDVSSIQTSVTGAQALVNLANSLQNMGGLLAAFVGDNDLGSFGNTLVPFGEGLYKYSVSVSGINVEDIQASVTAARALSNLASTLQNTGGMLSWFTGDNDLGTFGDTLVPLGNGLSNYSASISGVSFDSVTSSVSSIRSLSTMMNSLSGMDFSGAMAFKTAISQMGDFGISKLDTSISQTATQVATSLTNLSNAITTGTGPITTAVASLQTALNANGGLGTGLRNDLNSTVSTVQSANGNIQGALSQIVSSISGFVGQAQSAMSPLSGNMTTALGNAVSAVKGKVGEFKSAGDSLGKAVTEGAKSGIGDISGAVSSAASNGANGARSAYSSFYSAGSYVASGFAAGIRDNISSAANAAASMAASASAAAKRNLDIQSPSKVFYGIGKFVDQGFANGVTAYSRVASDATVKMASDSLSAFNNEIGNLDLNDPALNPVITPVMDMSNVDQGMSRIQGIQPMISAQMDYRLADRTASLFTRQQQQAITMPSNADVVQAIKALGQNIDTVGQNINGMAVNIDGRALVGQITTPIDKSLGDSVQYKQRWI